MEYEMTAIRRCSTLEFAASRDVSAANTISLRSVFPTRINNPIL
jgi:hypothetical protein